VPYRLVCTLRADFLRSLLDHVDVGSRLQDRLLPLSPMGVATLERAVSEPARVRGVQYDDGLARQIAIDAAGGGGGLPLMEFALTELWARQRRGRLTFADYHSSVVSREPSIGTPKVSLLSWRNAGWGTGSDG
jgi:hypothetical protein